MTISTNGLNFIKSCEGCVLHAYLDDTGTPTIGVGIIVYQNGEKVKMGDVITPEQSDSELAYQVGLKTHALNAMLTATVNQNQFDSLSDFCYNLGTGAFHGSTLRKLINANPHDINISAAFLVWDKLHSNGKLVSSAGLLRRRQAEVQLYFS